MTSSERSLYSLSRLRERVGERASLARANARPAARKVCPLPNPLPQTGEGTGKIRDREPEFQRRPDFFATALLALALLALARPAAADEVAARELFREARRLVASGDYAAACPKFEESLREEPGIGTTFNLADCWEHLGRTASAWSRFLDVAAVARASGQREREEVARGRASALEPKLSRLVIDNFSREPALTVERDGVPLAPSSIGIPVPVDPGAHVVEASAPNKKKWSVTVAVPGPSEVVHVEIPRLEDVEAAVPAVLPIAVTPHLVSTPEDSAPGPAAPSLAPAIVVGAAGVVGVSTAAIFGLRFRSVNDQAKAICPTSIYCTQNEIDTHDAKVSDARRDLTIAYVSAAVGVVALGAAAALWWRATSSDAGARRVAKRIAPVQFVLERGVGGGVRGVW